MKKLIILGLDIKPMTIKSGQYLFLRKGYYYFLIIIALAGCNSEPDDSTKSVELSGELEIRNAWARPASKGANSAAYLSIYNRTTDDDTLLSIQSEIAEKAEVHESYTTEEGLSGMRPAGKLIIATGDSLMLKPGGLHIMLMDVSKELTGDDSLQLQLEFANSGFKNLSIPVRY